MNRLLVAGLLLGAVLSGCRHARRNESSARADWVVRIRDFRFQPAHLTVRVGDYVTWINDDAFLHTASMDQSWSSGELRRGQRSHQWIPEQPGKYSYHCFAHPTMLATITVLERPAR